MLVADRVPAPVPDVGGSLLGLQVSSKNYDTGRSGANIKETILNQSNVKSGRFGKIGELQIDDQALGGLLYLSDLTIQGQKRNALFATTANNTIYAFDADKLGAPIWERNVNKDFNASGRPSFNSDINFNGNVNYSGNVGIVGTPAINLSTKTMHFVTRTEEEGTAVQRLWAIDITDGRNRVDPVVIVSNDFTAKLNNQRPGLAYGNDTVYISWASFGDAAPFHGIVKGYDSKTLTLTGVFNVTPTGVMGGIWMAGGAPPIDSEGNLYVATGNGTWNMNTDFGTSVVKLKARTLEVVDWFTPYNWEALNNSDDDLGSSFPMILPELNMMIIGGKGKKIYLLNTDNLGRIADLDSQIPQSWAIAGHLHHGIAALRGPNGLTLYIWCEDDNLRAYRFDPSMKKFIVPSVAQSSIRVPGGMPGGVLAISSDGDKAGTGVVWATMPLGDAVTLSVPGKFLAFSAEEVDGELPLLWSSEAPEDDMHNFSKGSPPLVANGRVYVGSLSNVISVYGLK